jgi:dolichyl-phosphate beta-glucosyltransferase
LEPATYSIILPAYNESARIAGTLDKILAHAAQRGWIIEVIVVNDGSSDDTVAIVHEYASNHAVLRLLENPGNCGKGYSVRNGMLHAQGDILLFSDADLSSPIEEADKLFAAMHRRIFGRIFNLALRIILGLQYKDTQCGFKAFTRRSAQAVFPLQKIERWGFDPELLYLARKFGFTVSEVPVAWSHREGTRIHPLRDGIRMFGELLRVRWYALKGNYAACDAAVSQPL